MSAPTYVIPPDSILDAGPGQCPACCREVVRLLLKDAAESRRWVSAHLIATNRYTLHDCPAEKGKAA